MKWFRVKYEHAPVVVERLRELEKGLNVNRLLRVVTPGEVFAVALCDVIPGIIRFFNMLAPALKQEEEITLREGLEYTGDDVWPAWTSAYPTYRPGKRAIETPKAVSIDEIVDGIITNFDDAHARSLPTKANIKECGCPISHLGVLHTIECQPLPYSPWPIRQPVPTLSAKEINAAHMCKYDWIDSPDIMGLRARDDAARAERALLPSGGFLPHGGFLHDNRIWYSNTTAPEAVKAAAALLTPQQAVELLRQDFDQDKKDLAGAYDLSHPYTSKGKKK